MKHLQINKLVLVLALSLIGFACSDSSTGPENPGPDTAVIEGRVDESNSGTETATPSNEPEGSSATVVTAATVLQAVLL